MGLILRLISIMIVTMSSINRFKGRLVNHLSGDFVRYGAHSLFIESDALALLK